MKRSFFRSLKASQLAEPRTLLTRCLHCASLIRWSRLLPVPAVFDEGRETHHDNNDSSSSSSSSSSNNDENYDNDSVNNNNNDDNHDNTINNNDDDNINKIMMLIRCRSLTPLNSL